MRAAGSAWNRFWFEPQPTSTLALFRIAFGTIAFFWGLSFLPDFEAFFSPYGVEPVAPANPPDGYWGLLNLTDSYTAAVALYVVLLVSALCVLVGYRTRLASVLLFVAIVSFDRRAPSIFNSGDGLVRCLAFCLMLAPAGAALSVDRWRRSRDPFWEFPARAPWALRLVQIQVSVVYLASVWEKLQGDAWRDGTAVSYALRLEDYERFALPGDLSHSLLVSGAMTYGTLAAELMLGVLVWNRAARPLVLAIGVSLHIGIGFTLRIGFFSEAMLTAYVAFVTPAFATALILAGRERLSSVALRRGGRAPAAARLMTTRR
jgi:uncharacterized membrane protein YphA (DoxX/SURF4 family)